MDNQSVDSFKPFYLFFKRCRLDAVDKIIMPNLWLFLLLLPMIWYAYTLLRLKAMPPHKLAKVEKSAMPFVSVLIPFRNESRWLPMLLDSLGKQDYPSELWELIMIDDHSLDDGPVMVKKAMKEMKVSTHLIQMGEGYGKKEALSQGVSLARSEWILATDADCNFEGGWIRSFAECIANKQAGMICGPVLYHKDPSTWLAAFQKFEQAILMFISRAAIKQGKPFLANGANMAFKKAHFLKADLKENYTASGDDIFLLHYIKQKANDTIIFNDAEEALVRTPAKSSTLRFLDQRIRWASKSRYYHDTDSLKYGLAIALANGIQLFALLLYLFDFLSIWAFLVLIAVKFIVDLVVFIRARHYSEVQQPYLAFLMSFVFYPFYTIGIALLSLLYKPRWKGRKI
jgi:cellulose synthase/poly-beta-1,6-N-acetylglucosamine synthase-like glycosyltransferase